jgi:hypothetical protein
MVGNTNGIREKLPLVTETVTGTTNASGILASTIATANKILIFAECAGYICLPFYGSSNIMAVKVEQQNGSALASTRVTVKFSYIEL